MPTPTNPFQVGDRVVAARTIFIPHGATGTVFRVLDGANVDVRWDDLPPGTPHVIAVVKLDRLADTHADQLARAFGC